MEALTASTSKTICSICFEDLKPVVEDLQAIPVCGHVFHELCLQQWFEYCPKTKKHSCPICKQSCVANKVCRLYFQSVGDVGDPSLGSRTCGHEEEDPVVLLREVRRLEAKVQGLTTVLEQQGKDLKMCNDELHLCREEVKKETSLKEDAFKQKITIQQLLQIKSQEHNKTALECLSLQERNMALAKELAALKLVADLDLEENEVLKLACLGNEANNKDTIDILRKSLVIRNKSYKELMAKCNTLGRGEARYSKKLEKAKEKINKLKVRIQELEAAIEVKDNQALRALKDSRRPNSDGLSVASFVDSTDRRSLPVDKRRKLSQSLSDFRLFGNAMKDANAASEKENIGAIGNQLANTNHIPRGQTDTSPSQSILAGKGVADSPVLEQAAQNGGCAKSKRPNPERSSNLNHEDIPSIVPNAPGLIESRDKRNTKTENDASIDDDLIILNDIMREESTLKIRKETPMPVPLCKPGDICVSGGLFGPDGRPRYLGKWCKRGQNKTVIGMKSSGISNGDLIAVGSDGRGGRVKALRSPFQSSANYTENSAKRCKSLSKPTFSQSQGSLQIEHFFGKISH